MIGNRRWWRVVLAVVVLAVTGPAWAADRLALVMGNATYNAGSGWRPLRQAVDDARAVAERLRKAGFTVIDGYNLTNKEMTAKLADLVRAMSGKEKPELVVVYYSGHGADFFGQNYLIPVDVNLVGDDITEPELEELYFPLYSKIIKRLGGGSGRSNIVILDSCRNDPLVKGGGGSSSKGLENAKPFSDMGKPSGTRIVYAAKPGSFSFESPATDKYSIFTGAVLEVWDQEPGINVATLFAKAGQLTQLRASEIHRTQEPTTEGELATGLVVLTPERAADPADDGSWSQAEDAGTADAIRRYLSAFPRGRHVAEARAVLKERDRRPPQQQVVAVTPPPEPPAPVQPPVVQPVVGVYFEKGKVFRDCDMCPEMVVVPKGEFVMGSPDKEPDRGKDEGPQHRVTIGRDFAVGKFEVTFTDWDTCVVGGGCNGYKPEDAGGGRGRHPVINVSWADAQAYVAWLRKETAQPYRLLTEAEWEYTARAGTTTPFSMGQTITPDQANFDGRHRYNGSAVGMYGEQTTEVGMFPPNAFGLYDLHGNVWEWVEDCYADNYAEAAKGDTEYTTKNCRHRVLRGGSWGSSPGNLRSAKRRVGYSPGYRGNNSGFRVARTFF